MNLLVRENDFDKDYVYSSYKDFNALEKNAVKMFFARLEIRDADIYNNIEYKKKRAGNTTLIKVNYDKKDYSLVLVKNKLIDVLASDEVYLINEDNIFKRNGKQVEQYHIKNNELKKIFTTSFNNKVDSLRKYDEERIFINGMLYKLYPSKFISRKYDEIITKDDINDKSSIIYNEICPDILKNLLKNMVNSKIDAGIFVLESDDLVLHEESKQKLKTVVFQHITKTSYVNKDYFYYNPLTGKLETVREEKLDIIKENLNKKVSILNQNNKYVDAVIKKEKNNKK
ncbi:MAG: hypothetical protein MR296_04620 [Tenericutes bacterium]|nr:hypothetical protein [Mycoplasmatota bacterium]